MLLIHNGFRSRCPPLNKKCDEIELNDGKYIYVYMKYGITYSIFYILHNNLFIL